MAFEFQKLTVCQKAKAFHSGITEDILESEGLKDSIETDHLDFAR